MKRKKHDYEFYAQIAVVVVLAIILVYQLNIPGNTGNSIGTVSASSIVPSGIPEVYGEELGISYDLVSASNPQLSDQAISFLGNIDRTETLEGGNLERYIDILYNQNNGISCEYCCGARSVIFENGDMACGCAHSYAMRGLAKYLIKYHGDEMSDEQILAEVGKWKVLFFPGIMENKAEAMKANGLSIDYISLASNRYRGIEKSSAQGGGMIGQC